MKSLNADTALSKQCRWSNILKPLIFLAIPTIIEEILSTLLQYVDTAMVGHLGEKATAAVSVTTTVTWLVNSIPYAIGIGSIALISQAFGARDKENLQSYSKAVFALSVAAGTVLGIVSVSLSPFIPLWMGAGEDVAQDASAYFFIISVPMMFRTFVIVLGSAIRAVADTRTPMVITMVENILNAVLNYILIYIAGLGVIGAAIGSAISYVVSGILMLFVFLRNKEIGFSFGGGVYRQKILFVVRQSIPVLGAHVSSCLAYVVFARLVSGMGTRIFAAHSIAITAETLFYIPGYGLKTACSTLVGISIGERNEQKFKSVCAMSILVTMLLMVFTGALLYFVSQPLMNLMTSSKEVADLGARMLRLVAFSEPFFGLMIVSEGILYGQGRTKTPFVGELVTMWGIRVLFTFLCTSVWNLDLQAVWYCMIACNVAKAIFFTVPLFGIKRSWQKLMEPKID